jgi:hypothetical protein
MPPESPGEERAADMGQPPGTNDAAGSWLERFAAKANAKREAIRHQESEAAQKHCVRCGKPVKNPLSFRGNDGPNCIKCNGGD